MHLPYIPAWTFRSALRPGGIAAAFSIAPPGGPSAGALGALLRGHPKQHMTQLS
jgi:hypothetical protein